MHSFSADTHEGGPGHWGAMVQVLTPEQSTMQAHALLQSMSPRQEARPSHSTMHEPLPQEMEPAHVFLASQPTLHESPLQEMEPAHDPSPSHSIVHGMSPHATLSGQLSSPIQFTSHSVASAGHRTCSQLR